MGQLVLGRQQRVLQCGRARAVTHRPVVDVWGDDAALARAGCVSLVCLRDVHVYIVVMRWMSVSVRRGLDKCVCAIYSIY